MTPLASDAIAGLGALGNRFVGWRWENRNGKPTKPPVRPTGAYADSTDPASWCSLDEAIAVAERPGFDGMGFVLDAARDGIVGVDLDGCRNPSTGGVEGWATRIINGLLSYTEVSPSGTGVKILVRADPVPRFAANKVVIHKANGSGKDQAVEVYTTGRYFCLTGQMLPGVPDEVVENTEAVEKLAHWIAKQAGAGPTSDTCGDLPQAFLDLVDRDPVLRSAWETGTKLGKGADRSASALDWSLALYLRPHLNDCDIGFVLRQHRHGQIGGGKLRGAAAERRIEKVLAELPPFGTHKSGGSGSFGGASSQDSRESKPLDWPDPARLPEGLPPVQSFDPILLPDRLRPWITDIAERMQVPLDFPAIASMVGLGAVVGRRLGIRPKRHDDWTVVPNLFGGIVGRPGLLKTPALQEACRPLIRLEMAAKDEFKRAQAEYEAQQRIDKQQKKLQDDKIAKDLKSNRDPKGILHDLLAAGDEDPPPVRRRYVVNDSTMEKLGEILSHNPNGVLIFRDELTGFLRQMERDGHEQGRAFYAQ